MEKRDTIRVGVLGLGKMGILHTALINMIPGAELAALSDIDGRLAKYVKNSGMNAPFFTDLDRMLEQTELDAVVICTPSFANLGAVEKCSAKSLHIFIEKPLAHTFEAAKKMAAIAAESDSVHAIGYLFSQMALFKKAKELLDGGIIGNFFRFRSSIYISEVFSRRKGWYYDREKSGGGAVINIASHLLYLLYWYFGPVRTVFAQTRSQYSGLDDCGTALFEYEGGLSGSLDVSWSIPGYRLSYVHLVVEGDGGTLELTNDDIKLHLFKARTGFSEGWTTLHKIDLPPCSRFELGGEGYYEEDLDFIQACLTGRPPAVTWRDGLEIQRIIEAVYRSSDNRRMILMEEVV